MQLGEGPGKPRGSSALIRSRLISATATEAALPPHPCLYQFACHSAANGPPASGLFLVRCRAHSEQPIDPSSWIGYFVRTEREKSAAACKMPEVNSDLVS